MEKMSHGKNILYTRNPKATRLGDGNELAGEIGEWDSLWGSEDQCDPHNPFSIWGSVSSCQQDGMDSETDWVWLFFFLIDVIIVHNIVKFQVYIIICQSPYICAPLPLMPFLQPPSPLGTTNLFSLSMCYFIFHISVESYGVCLSLSGLFRLT